MDDEGLRLWVLSERLSPAVSQCLLEAGEVAREAGHPEVGPVHVLFALLTQEPDFQPGLQRAALWGLIQASADGGNLKACPRPSPLAQATEKHFLLAAFEQGTPGAIMLRALGSHPDRLREIVLATPSVELEPKTFGDTWAYFAWLLHEPESLGRRVLEKLGVPHKELGRWILREAPTFEKRGTRLEELAMRAFALAQELDPVEITSRHLLSALLKSPDVLPLYWVQGQRAEPPSESGDWGDVIFGNPRLIHPGGLSAQECGSPTVEPLHLFFDGLQLPRFQLPFYSLRQAIKQHLGTADRPRELQELTYAPASIAILQEAGLECLKRASLPNPLLVSWCALRSQDPEILALVADPGALLAEFEVLLWGCLPLTTLLVDGSTLTADSKVLFHADSHYNDAERLVGLGRVGRWIAHPCGRVRIDVDQSGFASVALKSYSL